ncbi:PepSY-associated TM helix domain-containing protein [Bradyrhizobium sp. CB82]|uniref:PepSY-associated TM helix domain-containing protein n=1 Tax=Bradyrhizobium sp. CB82 TaxID=3039159 RepID=UPI0024B11E23|nr:PepSY-associated TM helix domain-containing protein [Bradyrhizobium sp. CB82]WFU41655.1 PepSY-associated TM helix domain-containing protein [Bradyrhizobium sp. CB82]
MGARRIKALLLEVHSVLGLVIALVLAVIGITGAIMTFEDETLDHLNADIMHVAPRALPMLTPDQLVVRLKATQDVGKVSGLMMTRDASAAVHVRFARDGQSARPSSLYVDPYDARVLGTPRGEEFFATVRRLHRWLLLPGDGNGYGRQITGIAALGLIALLVSGLVLRWPQRAGSVKMWLKPNVALRGRGLHRSLHAVIGTWVLPIYLAMTLTGLWYSFDWYKECVVWLLSRPSTAAARMPPKSPHAPASESAETPGFDRAWSTFLREQSSPFARAQLTLPGANGTVMRVRSWPQESTLEGARDEFRIDAVTGRLVSADSSANRTLGERAIAGVLDIHRGAILGWPGKLAFMLAAGLMPLFAVTGVLLYLSRRRHRRAGGAGESIAMSRSMPARRSGPNW